MSDQDRYIPGVPCWVDISAPEPQAAVAFYGKLFGWEFENILPAGSPVPYYVARIRGGDVAGVGSAQDGASAAVWNTYVWVDDADETASKVRAARGTVLRAPEQVGESGRRAVFVDPDGAVFRVWQADLHRGAAIVNEPGSLNFNGLSTRDVGGVTAFYGSVFGWERLDMGGADMWALAGYGDFLERRTPGMRENMAQMGAPERFEDVVAALAPIADEEPDVGSHWGVTFGVDDADAVAARAVELGGRVIVAPFDAPWVRMTIISDPQGATFTASKFVPENSGVAESAAAAANA